MRQEKCSFACLHEFFSSQEVSSLYIYKVLEEKNSVRQVKACCLLDFEPSYDFMHGSANLSVHFFLVADLGKLGKEETRNTREVKSEFIWHDLHGRQINLLRLTIGFMVDFEGGSFSVSVHFWLSHSCISMLSQLNFSRTFRAQSKQSSLKSECSQATCQCV